MYINETVWNNTVDLNCDDSSSYRNPYNNFTCVEHKKCKNWIHILRSDQFNELLEECQVTCNTCLNSTTSTTSSFAKTNGNSVSSLQSNSLTTVAVLSTFGFVAISAMLIGLFVIHKRSGGPIPLARNQDRVRVHFDEFHSEDVLDSEMSVCASSDVASSKLSSLPSSVLDIESSTTSSTTSCIDHKKEAANRSSLKRGSTSDVISPINGFVPPESPAPRYFDDKCFTCTKGSSAVTISPTESGKGDTNSGAVDVGKSLPKSSSVDSGDGEAPKVVHLLGYCLSSSSSSSEAV